jgi:hypothetical protein
MAERRWHRVGEASRFGPSPDGVETESGWSWRISRDGMNRSVRVEVVCGLSLRPTDLPAASRNAIRSRGASAVDSVLDLDEPPERLVVSTLGVRAREQLR